MSTIFSLDQVLACTESATSEYSTTSQCLSALLGRSGRVKFILIDVLAVWENASTTVLYIDTSGTAINVSWACHFSLDMPLFPARLDDLQLLGVCIYQCVRARVSFERLCERTRGVFRTQFIFTLFTWSKRTKTIASLLHLQRDTTQRRADLHVIPQ